MAKRSPYQTRQKTLVLAFMDAYSDAYLTVDEACRLLSAEGHEIGRTTVYRTLESAAAEGAMAKVAGTRGGAAHYRSRSKTPTSQGQLLCTKCGKAFPLECTMLNDFARHVEQHHGFEIDQTCTVLYGVCVSCRSKESREQK